tara:strand:+ start:443 stop:1279 length:837 start_codon:yes stop_codon:yes gene_type:complete
MKQPTYFCDHCNIEKFDSENLEFEPISFECGTKAHWKQHIDTKKHILNTIICKNLEADSVVECKHCGINYTKEQYKQHTLRNSVLWTMKTPKNIYCDSKCNDFNYEGKRFNNIKIMKEYIEQSNRYKKTQTKKLKLRNELIKLLDDEDAKAELYEIRRQQQKDKEKVEYDKKKESKRVKEEKEKERKELNKNPKPNIKMIINDDDLHSDCSEESYDSETETAVEKAQRERKDFNIPPEIDPDDLCEECNNTTNEYLVYPPEKLKRYGYSLCYCGEDED